MTWPSWKMMLAQKGNQEVHAVLQLTSCFLSRWLFQKAYHTSCKRIQPSKSRRILVCGDGNLSFSAQLAVSLRNGEDGLFGRDTQVPIHLTATVLETKTEHTKGKSMQIMHHWRKLAMSAVVSVAVVAFLKCWYIYWICIAIHPFY